MGWVELQAPENEERTDVYGYIKVVERGCALTTQRKACTLE